MNARRTVPIFATLLGAALASASGWAAQRTFVASYGIDTHPCTIAAPCRSFGIAIAAADPDGEVIALDSAGYGAFTVTKSISVVAPPGLYAGITVTTVDGVTVNAPGIRVTLRNLTINGLPGSTGGGIMLLQGASLAIEDCTISNVAGGIGTSVAADITVARTTFRHNTDGISMDAAGRLTVVDSLVVDNDNVGISVSSGAAGTITRTLSAYNYAGIAAYASFPGTSLSLTSSTISGNLGYAGVTVETGSAPSFVRVDISGNTLAGNGFTGLWLDASNGGAGNGGTLRGSVTRNQIVTSLFQGVLVDGADATVRLSGNYVLHNCCGIFQGASGGTPYSLGDNYVRDNTSADDFGVVADSPL